MNKKGIFLPLFVFMTILILSILFYTIRGAQEQKQDFIGLRAIKLVNLYNEIERSNLFIDLAARRAIIESFKVIEVNGGFSEDAACQKTKFDLLEKQSYVIFNTCKPITIDSEFRKQFEKELKNYLSLYESDYTQSLNPPFYFKQLKLEDTKEAYKKLYSDKIKNLQITELVESENEFKITFQELSYEIEGADGNLLFNPKTKTKIPDLNIFTKIHNAISSYCIGKLYASCEEKIKEQFPVSTIVNAEGLVKLSIPNGENSIKIAFTLV
jgi:hypothetical protein